MIQIAAIEIIVCLTPLHIIVAKKAAMGTDTNRRMENFAWTGSTIMSEIETHSFTWCDSFDFWWDFKKNTVLNNHSAFRYGFEKICENIVFYTDGFKTDIGLIQQYRSTISDPQITLNISNCLSEVNG